MLPHLMQTAPWFSGGKPQAIIFKKTSDWLSELLLKILYTSPNVLKSWGKRPWVQKKKTQVCEQSYNNV